MFQYYKNNQSLLAESIESTTLMKYLLLLLAILATSFTSMNAQIASPTQTDFPTSDQEAKYLAPIPEENGKVYLIRELELPANTNSDETFAKLQTWFSRCMQDSRISQHINIPTELPQTLQSQVVQLITFSSGLLSLDTTEMTYVVSVSLQGNKIVLKMSHISYKYNGENRDRKMLRYTAEEFISDRVALNKKHTKLILGYKKFRIKTIDLIDEYENSLKNAFWIK